MKPLSLDLRERIVRACDEGGQTQAEVAERFAVSGRTVRRLLRLWRAGGGVAPKPHAGGFASSVDAAVREQVRGLVRQQPDATLAELCRRLRDGGGPSVKRSRMCQVLAAMGLPRKKVAARQRAGRA